MKRTLRHTLYIWVILFSLLLTGCWKHSPVAEKLLQAETVMNEHPDSALNLLKGIAQPELQTKEHRARYALLYSQALDKNYIDVTNDSLIRVAVDYYKTKADVKAKFHAYYYLGRVHTNAKELTQAILAYMEAGQLVDELGDDYSAGLLYKQLGEIYRSYYDFPKSLQANQQAIEHFTKAEKPIHKIQTMLTLSGLFRNQNKEEEGYQVLKSALNESQKLNNQALVKSCIGNLVMTCIDMGKWEEATRLYQEYVKNDSYKSMTVPFMAYIARLYAKNKNIKEAFSFIDEAWGKSRSLQDTINLHYAESQLHSMAGAWEQAYHSMEDGIDSQNSVIRQSLQQPVLTAQKNFLNQELSYKEYRLKMEKYIRLLGFAILLFVSAIVIYFLRKTLRKHYRKRIKEKLQKQRSDYEIKLGKLEKEASERQNSIDTIVHLLEKEYAKKVSLSQQSLESVKSELETTKHHIKESEKARQESSERIKDLTRDKELLRNELDNQKCTIKKMKETNDAYQIDNDLKNKLLKKHFILLENLITVSRKKYKAKEKLSENDVKLSAYLKLYKDAIADFNDPDMKTKLEKIVNECNNNIMKDLRAEITLPDESYYQLACYLLAGYSVGVIACVMNETKNTIYKRRDKIRSIIKESPSIYKEKFLQV